MLCGSFSESKAKVLKLADVDGRIFLKTLDLLFGRKDDEEMELSEVQQLASVADRFQITEVFSMLEEALKRQLTLDMCGDVLVWSGECGMLRLEEEALKMAAERFEAFAQTAGFMRMGDEALGNVLDDDRLVARNEEAVWEAVVGWMSGSSGATRGPGGVGQIRFPLMEEEYLAYRVVRMVGDADGEWIAGVVEEALRAKAARREGRGAAFAFELLGRKALEDRVGLGVRWEECREGGELRLGGHGGAVRALAACDGRICSGSEDGSIRVWGGRASGGPERTLQADSDEGTPDPVLALAVWEGRLVSGHQGGKLRAWNAATGECDQVLKGHDGPVRALAVCGPRLASGGRDGSVRVWGAGAGGLWASERALVGGGGEVLSLAGWRDSDKLASGSSDGGIRVWDAGTGAPAAALAGHAGAVWALAVHGDRLLSAAGDGTIRVWALGGTWATLRTVEAGGGGAEQRIQCLAVSGSKLVSGSGSSESGGPLAQVDSESAGGQITVWGLAELDPRQALPQPGGAGVGALLAVDGEVWGGVGADVVVWGRRK
jgi:F-box/WD-40 domain protein 7